MNTASAYFKQPQRVNFGFHYCSTEPASLGGSHFIRRVNNCRNGIVIAEIQIHTDNITLLRKIKDCSIKPKN